MKKNIYLKAAVLVLVILFLLASCSFKETNNTASMSNAGESSKESAASSKDQSAVETQDIELPDIIELHNKEIVPEIIPEAVDLTLFKKVKEVRLGKVDAGQINIILYSDQDNNIHGVFKYGGKQYILRNLGYASDLDLIEIHELQLVYNANGKKVMLVSGIGSSTLGYQYIFFDETNEKWLSFHNWGTSQVVDINNDDIKEVFLQFQGLHNNVPDLNILSFQNGGFMLTDINDEVYSNVKLDTSKSKIASTYTIRQDNKAIVEVSDLMSGKGAFLYSLEYDVQEPALLRLVKNKVK